MTAVARFSGHVVTRELDVRPRPRGGDWVVHRALDGRAVFLAWPVFLVVRRVERAHAPAETGGLLFGRVFQDVDGPYVLVTTAEPPATGEVEGTVATVRITAAGADAMTERVAAREPLADVVGWYHTHPRFDAYFSEVDKREQAHWAAPLSVGLVLAGDPIRREPYAVYVGPDSAETFTVDARAGAARLPRPGPERPAFRPAAPRTEARPGVPAPRLGVEDRRLLIALAVCVAVVTIVFAVLIVTLDSGGGDGGPVTVAPNVTFDPTQMPVGRGRP